MGTEPVFRDPDVQRAVWFLGALIHVRAGAAETGGRWAMAEHFAARGYNSPLHIHNREEETLLVIDGTMRVVCGDADYQVSAGGLAILPMGRPHAFVVTSPTARILALVQPAGFEDFVVEVGKPPTGPGLPSGSTASPNLAVLAATAARYGIDIIGPPPTP